MKFFAADPSCFLLEIDDLRRTPLPPLVEDNLEALTQVVSWAREFLCNSHPELGREGPVCPFVQASMDKCSFYMTVCRGHEFVPEQVLSTVMSYRDWFLELEPREVGEAFFKTILILFPDIDRAEVPKLIDATQQKLRPEYVAKGLMIGEFHPLPPQKGGLWNPDFRPLRCPVPMLVIRHMVPTDFPFLREDRDLVASYLAVCRDRIPPHIKKQVEEVTREFGLDLEEPSGRDAIHPRVRAALEAARVPFRVHRHADQPFPINGPHDFARALGYPMERITKSLFLRCRCHGRYIVAVCSVNKKVKLSRLAALVGCKRLELASPEELAVVIGYPIKGIPPVAVGHIPVFVDEGLFDFETVLMAAGEVAVEIEIAPADLQAVAGAEVVSRATELIFS